MYEPTYIIIKGEFGDFTMTQNAANEELEQLAYKLFNVEEELEIARQNNDWAAVVSLGKEKLRIEKDVLFFSNGNMEKFMEEFYAFAAESAEYACYC